MDPLSFVLLAAGTVFVAYVAWRAIDFARHRIVIAHDSLEWHIDPRRMHTRVLALPEHRAAGGERSYQLCRTDSGTWKMRLSEGSRFRMLDGAGRALHAASDKQRLEVREEVEIVLHETDWRPVPEPIARELEAQRTGRPSGMKLADEGSRVI